LQTVAHTLARQLARRGHQVRVVANRYPRRLPQREVYQGISVDRWQFLSPDWGHLRRGRWDLFLAALYYFPSTLRRLTRLLETFAPDAVNVHFPDVQIAPVLRLRRRFRFRLVVSLHGHDVERFTEQDGRAGRYGDGGLRALLAEADAVTACSRNLLQKAGRVEPSVGAKGTVIYNGIDPERFREKGRRSHDRPYFFAFGRLTRKKGFDLLLEAFARTAAEYPRVDLLLAGEGEERAALLAQTRRLGLRGRVFLVGRLAPREVVRCLNGCLFVAVPSRCEPFGITALEAVAAGKPVLATRVGGLGEFLLEVCRFCPGPEAPALLVEPTVEGLAEGLRCLARGPVLESRAGPKVLEDYSWARVAQRYEGVLAG
jgi:glycogen(starch) synthase